jgi:hypothetical protein
MDEEKHHLADYLTTLLTQDQPTHPCDIGGELRTDGTGLSEFGRHRAPARPRDGGKGTLSIPPEQYAFLRDHLLPPPTMMMVFGKTEYTPDTWHRHRGRRQDRRRRHVHLLLISIAAAVDHPSSISLTVWASGCNAGTEPATHSDRSYRRAERASDLSHPMHH